MRGMGVYYQSCVLWPPCWALPLLHPLAPPPLLQFLLVLPAWHMFICSKWEERTKIKIRVAIYKQLCKMEPLCIILRCHTLFLRTKMVT